MVFLDSSIVIYYVEQPTTWGSKAAADRLMALRASREQFAVTELVRMECLVGPIRAGDAALVADFAAFLSEADVMVLPITADTSERAAEIRASYRFGLTTEGAERHGKGD